MTTLSDLLNRANTEQLSSRELADEARQRGYVISHNTIARVLRGDHGTPSENTLHALADVLHFDVTELRTAAFLPAGELGPWEPPEGADRMGREEREAVNTIIRLLVRKAVEGHGPGSPAPNTVPPGKVTVKAVTVIPGEKRKTRGSGSRGRPSSPGH